MSHPVVISYKENCPKCEIEVSSEFVRAGYTRDGEALNWFEFWRKPCRVKWVSVAEVGLTKKLK